MAYWLDKHESFRSSFLLNVLQFIRIIFIFINSWGVNVEVRILFTNKLLLFEDLAVRYGSYGNSNVSFSKTLFREGKR